MKITLSRLAVLGLLAAAASTQASEPAPANNLGPGAAWDKSVEEYLIMRARFVKNLVDYMVDVDWEGIADKAVEEQALLEALIADIRAEANARPRYQDKPVIITSRPAC